MVETKPQYPAPTTRLLNPVKCRLCGLHWDKKASPTPPCNGGKSPHTDAEWEAFWAAEQALAARGQKRSEELGKTFCEMRGTISETSAKLQQEAKKRGQKIRSAVEQGYRSVADGATARTKAATT